MPTPFDPVALKDIIGELQIELETLVWLTDRTFVVFNLADLKEHAQFSGFPVAGLVYDSTAPLDNEVTSTSKRSASAGLHDTEIMLLIGEEYKAAGSGDTKPEAFDHLDELRRHILGRRTANNRPWRFAGEASVEAEDGVVFFAQRWVTSVSIVGVANR